jgi:hypothetical protein
MTELKNKNKWISRYPSTNLFFKKINKKKGKIHQIHNKISHYQSTNLFYKRINKKKGKIHQIHNKISHYQSTNLFFKRIKGKIHQIHNKVFNWDLNILKKITKINKLRNRFPFNYLMKF